MENSKLLWAIGSPDGRSEDLFDNYNQPDSLGDVVWRVSSTKEGPQQWPLFHPSEADPEGGYRLYPYTVLFPVEGEPAATYVLRISYLVIAARLAHLEVRVNGVSGTAYLKPEPSRSGEIIHLMGLHAAIYSEGVAEVVIPGNLLQQGENRLELVARDEGEIIHVTRIEQVKRLDRAANGAGFHYRMLSLSASEPVGHKAWVEPTVVYRRNKQGALVERCFLHLELGGPVAAATWRLNLGEETVAVEVPAVAFGHVRLPFDLPDGEGEVAWTLTGPGFTAEGGFRSRRKWQVFITPHAHTDIGYTHRQWEVAERLCRNIDYSLDMLAKEPSAYSYHLDCAWALEHYWATRSPRQKERLVQAIRRGGISVAGIYGDALTQIAGLEDLIRNSTHAHTLLRPAGLSTDFITVVDVASLTGSYPALLEGAGIKYLVHANNQDRGPFRLNGGLHLESPFYWEGTAGGRVLVWLSKMYCELRKVCGSPPVLSSSERGLEMWLQEYDRENYAPDAVLMYGQEADNTDMDPQPVSFVKQWNETYEYPKLIASDVGGFFRYVEERFADSFRVLRGDSGAYWEDGAGSSMAETMKVRYAQAALPAAERLEALAAVHTPDWAFPAEQFDTAWREVLLYDEHTWGAFLSAREPGALLAHDQWAVKKGFADQSEAWATRLLHTAAVRHALNWNNDGREVVVHNPHSWPVTGTVVVEVEPNEIPLDPATGQPVPMRRVKTLSSQSLIEILVERLEGLSYRRFVLGRAPQRGTGTDEVLEPTGPVVLENEHYRLVIDPALGAATSWYDKALGRELAEAPLGQFVYAKGGEGTRLMGNQSILPLGDPDLLTDFRLSRAEVRRYAYGETLMLQGESVCGGLTIEWTLPVTAKRVDLRFTLDKEERLVKEAVYVAFPTTLASAKVSSDSQLGWVNWDKEQLPGGCKEWLPLQTGILLQGQGADVLICSPNVPLFTVGDVVRGRWPKQMDLTGGRVYSYVLNNYWHTNYKASQGGTLQFAYRLTSGAKVAKPDAYRMGWEARRGLYGHRMSFQDFRTERAPYTAAGGTLATIGNENVVLSTMTAARWAEGYIVRLQEIAGTDQVAPVAIPGRRIAQAWLTDLLEQELFELKVLADGSLLVPVGAWSLATVRIVFEGGAEA